MKFESLQIPHYLSKRLIYNLNLRSPLNISIITKYFYCFLLWAAPLTTVLQAQNITPQKLIFSNICAGTFNEYDAIFNHSGFPTGTTFEVQLSDSTGNFSNPTATTTLATTDISASQKKIRFAIPVTLQGAANYKLRVKSSTGNTSANFNNNVSNSSFSVYYKSYEKSFSINKKANDVSLCAAASIVVSVDNSTPDILDSSPANYAQLNYKWYKDNVLLPGAITSSLTVNSPGVYYSEIDYGACSNSNYSSNRVTVNQVSTPNATITSSLGNPFCSSTATTVLSTEKGNSYQWYKDDIALAGATNQIYETNQAGNYAVKVNYGGCESKASLDLQTISIKGVLNINSPSLLESGEVKTVKVTTESPAPIFSWYRNENIIPNATLDSFEVTEEGKYKVKITGSTCAVSTEIPFVIGLSIDPNSTEIPNLISPNNDGINDTWSIPQKYTSGNEVEVLIVSSNGEQVLKTKDYLNNWPEDANTLITSHSVYYYVITSPNETIKRGSITVVK